MEKHFDKMDTQKTGFINIGSLSDYIINEFKMECDDQQKEDFKVKFHIKDIFVFFIHFAIRLLANIISVMRLVRFQINVGDMILVTDVADEICW